MSNSKKPAIGNLKGSPKGSADVKGGLLKKTSLSTSKTSTGKTTLSSPSKG